MAYQQCDRYENVTDAFFNLYYHKIERVSMFYYNSMSCGRYRCIF